MRRPSLDKKKRPWLHVAKSAVHKDSILALWDECTSVGYRPENEEEVEKANKLLRILVDCVTEHDKHTFPKLINLAMSKDLSFVSFIQKLPVHSWKACYRKTFIVAAFINSQPRTLTTEDELDSIVEQFEDWAHDEDPARREAVQKSLSLNHARANIFYLGGCFLHDEEAKISLTSASYDPPYISTSRGWHLMGVRQAIQRFEHPMKLEGFYDRDGQERCGMTVDIVPAEEKKGKLSIPLPFMNKPLRFTATIKQSNADIPEWEMDGTMNRETGSATFDSLNMLYYVWVTPWGIAGHKLNKKSPSNILGNFVLQWTATQ